MSKTDFGQTERMFYETLRRHGMMLRKDDFSGDMPQIEYVPYKLIVITSCNNAFSVWLERWEVPHSFSEDSFVMKAAAAWNRREYHT